jgi:hypothetical protein
MFADDRIRILAAAPPSCSVACRTDCFALHSSTASNLQDLPDYSAKNEATIPAKESYSDVVYSKSYHLGTATSRLLLAKVPSALMKNHSFQQWGFPKHSDRAAAELDARGGRETTKAFALVVDNVRCWILSILGVPGY